MAYVTSMPDACPRATCGGSDFALRKRMKANGTLLYAYQYQCMQCGCESGTVKASEVERLRLPSSAWDDTLHRKWWDGIQAAYDQQKQANRAEWFKGYDAYLASPAWKTKREKVLSRANGTCDGCGDRPPVQVHHLTYKHVGNEFLWELRAVCNACHDRAHEERAD
jgi:5-methylcytosine-specific restriction endonuclease McrA